jgi:hypothetical protein
MGHAIQINIWRKMLEPELGCVIKSENGNKMSFPKWKEIERFEHSNTLRYGVNESGCIHIPKWIGNLLKSKGGVHKISKFDFHFSSLEFQGVSIFWNKIWSNWAFFKPWILFLKNKYLKWGKKSNWNTSYGHLKGKSNYENDS